MVGEGSRISFTALVATGKGEAVGFTSAAWARASFLELVGIDPFPGTLNLTVMDGVAQAAWAQLRATGGRLMPPPDPAWCAGRLFPALLDGRIEGAIIVPEVADYATDQIEIIAAVNLRATLGIGDGDPVLVSALAP
ncbi:MAG: phosphoglycolate phosphatase [Alphaproteobacteria bacterium]|jgi:phosphoglycolate phosphatase